MNLYELQRLVNSIPLHKATTTLVAGEMPDDKSQYAVSGVRYDRESDSVIIEVS